MSQVFLVPKKLKREQHLPRTDYRGARKQQVGQAAGGGEEGGQTCLPPPGWRSRLSIIQFKWAGPNCKGIIEAELSALIPGLRSEECGGEKQMEASRSISFHGNVQQVIQF
ncbi:hypothetical protein NQZ68_014431 [Dissostichus eleginoides]|nr:hypothetical protein NQZ68_014431 [Dissostichus eleginoides]